MKKFFRPFLKGIAFLRRYTTQSRIRRESTQPWPVFADSQIGETRKLEILPLYEANVQNHYQGGSGVSYLVRTDHATILFDLGNNPSSASPSPLEQNMARMGISLKEIDLIFISHRHPDHVGGWQWWNKKTFSLDGVSQPALGTLPIYVCDRITYPGSKPVLTKVPTRLSDGVVTTGLFTFFEPYPAWQIMPNYSEHALAVNVAGLGMIVITGCGHMGLKTLFGRAKAIFHMPVVGVVGGLHYTDAGMGALLPDIQFLRDFHPHIVALSAHDSGPAAIDVFAQAFPESFQPIQVGEAITLQ